MHHVLRAMAGRPEFLDASAAYVLLDVDLRIRAVNDAYLAASGRDRTALLGEILVEAFPDNPDTPAADGVRNLTTSLTRVLRSARPHTMQVQRYDVEPVRGSGLFVERTWSPVNIPVLDERDRVTGILHRVEDITALAHLIAPSPAPGAAVEAARLREALTALVVARGPAGVSPAVVRRRQLWEAVCDRVGDRAWGGWSHALCRAVVTNLAGVDGAAVTACLGDGLQEFLATSDRTTAALEELQYTLGEGPTLTALTDRAPVFHDVATERGRWPGFARMPGSAGLTGVWAFPLSVAGTVLGTLTMYRRAPEPAGPDEWIDAAVLADLAGVAVLADLDRIDSELLARDGTTGSYREVSLAVGIVSAQLGLANDGALSALRARAFVTDRTLTDVARDVVDGRLRLD